jgi:hypothetical protein
MIALARRRGFEPKPTQLLRVSDPGHATTVLAEYVLPGVTIQPPVAAGPPGLQPRQQSGRRKRIFTYQLHLRNRTQQWP